MGLRKGQTRFSDRLSNWKEVLNPGNVVQSSQTDTLHSTQWLSQAGGIPGDLYVFICCVLHNEHVLQR